MISVGGIVSRRRRLRLLGRSAILCGCRFAPHAFIGHDLGLVFYFRIEFQHSYCLQHLRDRHAFLSVRHEQKIKILFGFQLAFPFVFNRLDTLKL